MELLGLDLYWLVKTVGKIGKKIYTNPLSVNNDLHIMNLVVSLQKGSHEKVNVVLLVLTLLTLHRCFTVTRYS